jgi:hypothetical protein
MVCFFFGFCFVFVCVFLSQYGLHAAGRRHCYISGTYGLIVSKPSLLIKYTCEYHKTAYHFPFPFTSIFCNIEGNELY